MLSRRNFLGLAGGVVILAACGSSDDDGSAGATTHRARSRREHAHASCRPR